jgi:hypothetical protein
VILKFKLKAGEKQIALWTEIEKDLPLVHADIGLIERVLENLIENAIQNTPRGGAIRLVLTPQNEDIMIQISDTDRAIPDWGWRLPKKFWNCTTVLSMLSAPWAPARRSAFSSPLNLLFYRLSGSTFRVPGLSTYRMRPNVISHP